MESLLLCIVSSVAFLHIMRLGQHYRRTMVWVGAWNYCTAALGCGLWLLFQPSIGWNWAETVIGLAIGAVLVAGFYLIDACIKLIGVGITQTIERLSAVLLPVGASIIFWQEFPTTMQFIGLLLALIALPLLTDSPMLSGAADHKPAVAIVIPLLVVSGTAGVLYKLRNEISGALAPPTFFCVVFGAAALIGVVVAARRAPSWNRGDVGIGISLGCANLASNYFYAASIAAMHGPIVFPSIAIGVILVGSLAAIIIWKERYSRRILLGILVATVALVLVNLDPN